MRKWNIEFLVCNMLEIEIGFLWLYDKKIENKYNENNI